MRGLLHKTLQLTAEERERGVITVSAGNAAGALAWAARNAQVPATVVMAKTAVQAKVDAARAYGAQVDVADTEQVAACVARVREDLGDIDILVNNAGIFGPLTPGPFEAITVDEWRRVMDVNVMGTFLMTKAVVSSMRARGGGRVVNLASTTPFKGVARVLHYTTSKGAVVAMTRALARELGADQILVNAVAPGFTVSDGIDGNADAMGTMRPNAPGQRAISREMLPDDIVGAVRFLAGPLSSFITGQTLVVDGGAYFH